MGDWENNRSEIEQLCSNQASGSGINALKTLKNGENLEVEEALFLCHERVREKSLLTSGPLTVTSGKGFEFL